MVLVIDDALLLTVLAGTASPELRNAMKRSELFTTGSWYYRLGRAGHDRTLTGALSSAIGALPPDRRARVQTGLEALPQEVGLLGMRRLVPVMRRLDVGRRLNFLTAEAVAAAVILRGALRVTTESRLLRDASRALAIDHQLVSL